MKCPQCSYVSFDGQYSCKKCGYLFTQKGGPEIEEDLKSLLFQNDEANKANPQKDGTSNVHKTVASIRESLDEIEGDKPGQSGGVSQNQPIQIETDELKLRVDVEYVEKRKQFPDHSDINWEESVPLSSDQLNLNIHEDIPQEDQETSETRETDIPYTETEEFKAEIRQIGEDLKQIEGVPAYAETVDRVRDTTGDFDISSAKKGGFWMRFVASIIDNLILYFLAVILSTVGLIALGMGSAGFESLDEEGMFQLFAPLYLFNSIITIFYYTYFHGNTGQTPGKMICKLKVVRINGDQLGYPRAFLRWVGYIVSSIFFCLGFLWIAWDKNKQGWHDKMAGSYVIYVK